MDREFLLISEGDLEKFVTQGQGGLSGGIPVGKRVQLDAEIAAASNQGTMIDGALLIGAGIKLDPQMAGRVAMEVLLEQQEVHKKAVAAMSVMSRLKNKIRPEGGE